jgi:hypothetical protein
MERYQTIEGIAKIETEVIQTPVHTVLPTGEKLKESCLGLKVFPVDVMTWPN